MSYDNPMTREYTFRSVDFGAASNTVLTIPVPKENPAVSGSQGRSGRVRAVGISNVSEDFAGSTSDAGVKVGDGTTAGKYYDTGLVLNETVDITDNATLELADTGSAVAIELGRSTLTVTCVASVGTPTGIADVTVVVDWA